MALSNRTVRQPPGRLILRLLPLAAWCGLVWTLSAQTPDAFGEEWWVPDWAAHIAEYAVGGFLARYAFCGRGPADGIAAAVAFCVLWAVLDEWHQSFVPGRDPSGMDIAADLLGTSLGVAAHAAVSRWRWPWDPVRQRA